MSLSEQIGKSFQSTQSRFRNSPKRRRCNAIECNFSVKKTYAFAVCMFCTSDIVNGAELFAERQYFFKSCVNRIRNIFHAVVLCSFLFDKAQEQDLISQPLQKTHRKRAFSLFLHIIVCISQ